MTLDKLVYDIREAIKDYTDDSELDNRYIEYLIALKRAKFLRQELDRFGRSFNNTILQNFCLPIETVSASSCNLNIGCDKLGRTTSPIPELLQLASRDALYRVAPTSNIAKTFSIIDHNKASFAKDSLFNSTKVFLHADGYLYFVNNDNVYPMDCIQIIGVFQDPVEVSKYQDCCDCANPSSCYDPYSDPYPVSPHLIDTIRMEVIQELAVREQLPEDLLNDSQDG